MENQYYVYSLRMSAWWTNVSSWSSDLKIAKRFGHAEAIEFCRSRYALPEDGLAAVPVAAADVERIMGK